MYHNPRGMAKLGNQAKAAAYATAAQAPRDVAKLRLFVALLGVALLAFSQTVPAFAQSGSALDGIRSLAKMFIDGIIGLSAILLAIGVATNFLTGMVEVMVGRPGGLSTTWMRIAGIVLCFIGAVFTILIANTIIDEIGKLKSSDDIHTPGG
jgi:hypothetical protein